jgi:hypothetical protein
MLKNMTAQQFNAKHPIGTAFQFHPILDVRGAWPVTYVTE